jgi:LacI family transcriptional regulator
MHHSKPPRVAVLVGTSTGWGRGIIRGIANYANKHGPWHVWVEGRGQDEPPRLPPGWVGEGIIARVSNPAIARLVASAGVPTVNVSSIMLSGVKLPQVANDVRATGRLAAQYLMDRGLRQFAYVGLPRLAYVQPHYQAFAATLAEAGFPCAVHSLAIGRAGWLARQEGLTAWLRQLPKPVGILTWATPQGRAVLDACRWGGLLVPEQVAVLSGDDDLLLCGICDPGLSGIAVAAEQIGHEAAAVLDRLLSGRRPPKRPILISPTGVVTRRSTEVLALENADLAQAIAFIREHAAEPIQVEDVLQVVAISRRQLERYFQETLGRTPAEEIRRVRLERAKELLATTDLPIPKVAAASGFGTGEYLATIFRQATGLTPLKYRSQIRGR